ncbi:YlbF family regulator [Paenibacillus senegalensis]|uniref:YlbF family regulator n=1 Tax=Paenibacillus senegalensis TaxID=1465766 RepID=UPI000289F861|nr:YlbF family regulator [Paenibacillus senegalensis]
MNVHDKARELSAAIRESKEYEDVKLAQQAVNADPESKRMMDQFRQKQMELQSQMMSGQQPAQEELDKMEKLYEVLSLNFSIRKLMESERRLSVVMEDVQKIMMESLQDLYSPS